jgi:hypothetical protein
LLKVLVSLGLGMPMNAPFASGRLMVGAWADGVRTGGMTVGACMAGASGRLMGTLCSTGVRAGCATVGV